MYSTREQKIKQSIKKDEYFLELNFILRMIRGNILCDKKYKKTSMALGQVIDDLIAVNVEYYLVKRDKIEMIKIKNS